MSAQINQQDLDSFSTHLKSSQRILALCGAGLSASSGLPTFRGAGGLWRNHDAVRIATPGAFQADPSLVWHFYSYRRHMALDVKPNPAHYALAALAKKKPEFLTLTQNVDGLSPRAGHDPRQIKYLHGSLFNVKCSSPMCSYKETNNFVDPIVPALAIPTEDPIDVADALPKPAASQNSPAQGLHGKPKEVDISDARINLDKIARKDLPQCPACDGLLRPGVVWFGEALEKKVTDAADNFINSARVDLMIVIGTSAAVWPAAGYIEEARDHGARVAVINMDPDTGHALTDRDWFFQGDASQVVPALFKGEIGELPIAEGQAQRADG